MRHATLMLRVVFFVFSAMSSLTSVVHAEGIPQANQGWEGADKKWADFSREYRQKMDALDAQDREKPAKRSKGGFDRTFVEIRSPLITKYLLAYRVFSDGHAVFLLRKDGEIVSLGDGEWSVYVEKEGAVTRNPRVSEFLAGQRIPVPNASVAIDIMNLSQELSGAPEAVAYFRSSSHDLLILDKRVLRNLLSGVLDWKHMAEKVGDQWLVASSYIGPPADVVEPSTFVVVVDSHGVLSGVFQKKTHP